MSTSAAARRFAARGQGWAMCRRDAQIFPGLSVYENLRMGFVENGVDSEENRSSRTSWHGFRGSIR